MFNTSGQPDKLLLDIKERWVLRYLKKVENAALIDLYVDIFGGAQDFFRLRNHANESA